MSCSVTTTSPPDVGAYNQSRSDAVGPRGFAGQAARGFLLIDCLAYMALLLVMLTLAFLAFHQMLDHSKKLQRNAADIARALDVGERWRAEVRTSVRAPRLEQTGHDLVLHLPRAQGEVLYSFRDGAVWRKDTARATAEWIAVIPKAQSSRMLAEGRKHVTAWRWELELAADKTPRVRPQFTFQAVARREATP
jgi:hypothetical protein